MKSKSFNAKETWNKVFSQLKIGQTVIVKGSSNCISVFAYHNLVGTLKAKTKAPNGWVYWAVLFKRKDNPNQRYKEEMATIRERHLVVI